jgi:hypothetical protein
MFLRMNGAIADGDWGTDRCLEDCEGGCELWVQGGKETTDPSGWVDSLAIYS